VLPTKLRNELSVASMIDFLDAWESFMIIPSLDVLLKDFVHTGFNIVHSNLVAHAKSRITSWRNGFAAGGGSLNDRN